MLSHENDLSASDAERESTALNQRYCEPSDEDILNDDDDDPHSSQQSLLENSSIEHAQHSDSSQVWGRTGSVSPALAPSFVDDGMSDLGTIDDDVLEDDGMNGYITEESDRDSILVDEASSSSPPPRTPPSGFPVLWNIGTWREDSVETDATFRDNPPMEEDMCTSGPLSDTPLSQKVLVDATALGHHLEAANLGIDTMSQADRSAFAYSYSSLPDW